MNDDNRMLNQNTPPVAPTVAEDQAQPQTVVQPIVPVALSAPVGSTNKEVGSIVSPVPEFVKPSEAEPQIEKDIAELGVEAKKDEPNITDEHKDFIDHAKQFTPVSSSPKSKITMPMSEEEVAEKLKTGQDDDSGKWLAGLIRKIIKIMGF